MPGRVATGTCSAPSKTRCSYTSSVTTQASCSRASAHTRSSSSRVKTLPVGLWGVLSSTSRVRSENAAAQGRLVDREVREAQHRRSPHATGQGDRRGVRVVVRLERHHLVTRLDERQHRRRDRLRRPDRDEHLGTRVDIQPVEALLVPRHRVEQLRDPGAGRVLVATTSDRRHRRIEHLDRAVGVGEPLPEVDRAVLGRERRHRREDRRAERGERGMSGGSGHGRRVCRASLLRPDAVPRRRPRGHLDRRNPRTTEGPGTWCPAPPCGSSTSAHREGERARRPGAGHRDVEPLDAAEPGGHRERHGGPADLVDRWGVRTVDRRRGELSARPKRTATVPAAGSVRLKSSDDRFTVTDSPGA